jgi:hypothetical protein
MTRMSLSITRASAKTPNSVSTESTFASSAISGDTSRMRRVPKCQMRTAVASTTVEASSVIRSPASCSRRVPGTRSSAWIMRTVATP